MDVTELIDRYCLVWSCDEHEGRRHLLQQVWAADATYIDPTVSTRGHDELLTHIAGVREKRPGSSVVRTSRVDMHHDVARFNWCVVESDGTRRPDGIDIALLAPDKRLITGIIGFFGPMPR